MKKIIGAGVGFGGALLPLFAFAQTDNLGSTSGITTFLNNIKTVLDTLLPIVVTLALLAFFWGLVKFIWSADDEKARQAGKSLMIWGVIALFVMVSIWGLVGVVQSLFGIDQDATSVTVPVVPGSSTR